MPTIVEDMGTGSAWIAKALTSSGYATDFSPASLWEIDRFFDDHAPGGQIKRRGLLSKQLGQRMVALGAYVGEVLRRELGGEWYGDDDDPEVEINVELRLPGDSIVWPVQRVMKRLQNGPEDGIAAYGSGLGLTVGPKPPPPTPVPWYKR